MSLSQLNEAFEFLEDWEDRYRFIMDLGRKLPPMPESEQVEENLVHGCQSTVWVSAESPDGPEAPVRLRAHRSQQQKAALGHFACTEIGL